ncbi:galectin-4-like [Protopterus annectens]|uniref:galectin-4-like n=1 Tax=Protopterus annectens TaxID=7888 RepID=UPI001CFA33FC|nr:galectin-4-like [Protopterus annectens]
MTFVAAPGYQPNYNPSVPFSSPIYGGLRPGMAIYIQGHLPHHADQFCINLTCGEYQGADIALHINPRYEGHDRVVFNTCQGGSWGNEEDKKQIPFKRGQHFEVLVQAKHDIYEVFVNGSRFYGYSHRIPLERVTAVHITGPLTLQTVNIIGGMTGPAMPIPAQPSMGYPALYVQRDGVAMGTSCANSYANVVMADWETENLFKMCKFKENALFYTRFVDDLFLIWKAEDSKLTEFYQDMNTTTEYLKFTMIKSHDCIAYLDVFVHSLPNGLLNTGIYRKDCYRNTYLHRSSMHPNHIFNNIIKGQAMRISRLSSDQQGFQTEMDGLIQKFLNRSYGIEEINANISDIENLRKEKASSYFAKSNIAVEDTTSSNNTDNRSMGNAVVYNPTIPYVAHIPGGLSPKKTIIVRGNIPYGATGFHINFKAGYSNDIALHINPRFNEQAVVRNSLIGGCWGSEERGLSYNPFQPGQFFDLSIRSGNGRFKVFVNGQHAFDYVHRLHSLQQIDLMEIGGDVSISYIQL